MLTRTGCRKGKPMPFPLENALDAQALAGALPPGISLWWVRGKVLRSEIVERPVWLDRTSVYDQGGMAHYVMPDTLLALSDRDASGNAFEIRLQGRINTVAPGEELELLGHITPHDAAFLPRMAVSVKHNHWWPALPPVRPGEPAFIVRETNNFRTMKRDNSYAKELDGLFSVNVPKPVNAAPVAPASSPFGKLLGAAKQAAGAAAPSMIAADLRPVYLWIYPALVAFAAQQVAQKPAPVAYADDSDDLPPL